MDVQFIPGLKLNTLYYAEVVKPLLAAHFPGLVYSAALIGYGSDVLGFDTPQSMDHDWGPRVMLFLSTADVQAFQEPLNRMFQEQLPQEFRGFPTRFGRHEDQTTMMSLTGKEHGIRVFSMTDFFARLLRFPLNGDPGLLDWLTTPSQYLRSLTGGAVFYDGLGQLEPLRGRLQFYPQDVWFYLMACQWVRISQEEPFMGRCGQAGDELGSHLVAGRLVRDLMRLCFLIERQYAPYIKWFGTAFSHLRCAGALTPLLTGAMNATSWQAREKFMTAAYAQVAEMHNTLKITPPLPTGTSPFYGRPFMVIHAGDFASAIRQVIQDKAIQALPDFGSIDQFADSTDVLDTPACFEKFQALYQEGMPK